MTSSLDTQYLGRLSKRLGDNLWFILAQTTLGFGGMFFGALVNLPLGLAMILVSSVMVMFTSDDMTFTSARAFWKRLVCSSLLQFGAMAFFMFILYAIAAKP